MAHSFVQAHDDEAQAFTHFAESFPANAMLLIDTYDTVEGARRVAEIAPRLAARGIRIKGVRLDSGDLDALARAVRGVLDEAGLRDTVIFASGNLDEQRVHALVAGGAPITSFGIGTSLTTSSDAPYLDAVYKLQEYAGRARRKRSSGKATWPGRKQVFRRLDASGHCVGDTVALNTETFPGEPLLAEVMRGGRRIAPSPPLAVTRAHCSAQLATLPSELRRLDPPSPTYPVTISPAIKALADDVDHRQANAAAALVS
jgi:nicotinate phosphoribosyltransferase